MLKKLLLKLKNKIEKKIPEPDNVYEAIFPLYFICGLFGLAPYKSVRIENGKRQYRNAIWPKIKSCIHVGIFSVCIYLNIYLHKAPFYGSDISVKLEYFQQVCSGLLSMLEVILGIIFATKVVQVFKNVRLVDISFKSLAVWVPYKPIYVQIVIHIIAGFTLFITIIAVIFSKKENQDNSLDNVFSTVTPSVSYLVNLVMEFQYFNYLSILRTRYQLLNEYLEALVHENKRCYGWTEVLKIDPETSKKFSKSISKSVAAISDPVFIIDKIATLHIKLSDTAILINSAFSVQLLIRITIAFVSIVTALFLIAVNFSKSSGDEKRMNLNALFTAWAFSSALEILAVVWITSNTCEEANKSPRLLHRIRNNTTNVKLQDVIEIYSLQMYHNRLHFTICGLFPLDYTLLYTIVAGVTTYLVILIQFSNSDKNNPNDTIIANTNKAITSSNSCNETY